MAVIDAETAAQRIKIGAGTGEFAAGQGHRIQRPVHRQRVTAKSFEFGIDEPHIKGSVMDDQTRIAQKCHEIIDNIGKQGLVIEEFIGQAVNSD